MSRHSELRTILAADLEGFAERLVQDEDRAVRLLVDTYYAMVSRHALSQGGCLFRKEGDSVWCSFSSALGGVKAAIGLLEEALVRNRAQPQGQELRLRAGLHLGDVTLTQDGDLLGHTLSVAKRLETACEVGTVNLSEEVYSQIAGRRLSFEFRDQGVVDLKGIGPRRIFNGHLRPERQGELASPQAGPAARLLVAFHLGGERLALRLAAALAGESAVDTQAALALVWVEPGRTGEVVSQLLAEESLPRCVLSLGSLLRAQDGGLVGTALEEALEALEAGQEASVLCTEPASRYLSAPLEPYAGVAGRAVYRLTPDCGELTYAHQPRRVLSWAGGRPVEIVVGASILASSSRAHLERHPEVGLAVACAQMASAAGWGLPAGVLAVGRVDPEGTVSQGRLELPGEPPFEVTSTQQLSQILQARSGQGHLLALREAYLGDQLTLVLAGPLGEQDQLLEALGLADLEEAEQELGSQVLAERVQAWSRSLPPSPTAQLLLQLPRLQLVCLFPEPRLAGHPGLHPKESCPANGTLLLWGPSPGLKLFHRQLRVQLACPPRTYLLEECPEERWWGRRGVTCLGLPLPNLLEQLADTPPRPPQQVSLAAFPSRPYKFLDYYTASDRAIFFGRNQEVDQLYNRLLAHPMLVLYGRSGVGKTSLLRAGVLPRLPRPHNLTLTIRCLQDPTRLLLQELAPQAGDLAQAVGSVTGTISGHLVIVIDQFEEFFIRLSPPERQEFERQVARVVRAEIPRVHLVFSMREDFLAEMAEFEVHLPGLLDHRFRLTALDEDQARAAIVGPAELFGISFEARLVDQLLSDLKDEGVDPPELQIVLDRLYQARRGFTIPLEVYQRLGGVQHILVDYLHTTLAEGLPAPAGSQTTLVLRRRDLPRQVLKAMVTERGTKAVVSLSQVVCQLRASEEEVSQVLLGLVHTRLVRGLVDEQGQDVYELAHEYIIQEVLSWASEQELALRHARMVLRSELESWKRLGSLMSADRLALISRERTRLELDPEERALMLRAAAVHGESLARWALPQSTSVLLALLEEPELSPQARRRVLDNLVGRPLEDRATEVVLACMERIGNPELLLGMRTTFGVSPRLLGELEQRMRRRFFGPQRMTRVPPGPALLGSAAENRCQRKLEIPLHWHARVDSEADLHLVELEEFWLDRCLVTNQEFAEFRSSHIHRFPQDRADHPACYVNWNDACEYASWLGKELPGEEQWEKAARGSQGQLYPWGDAFEPDCCNSAESAKRTTTPVGAYPQGASPYGCLDMAGNVWEWTRSSWAAQGPFKTQKGGSTLDAWPLQQPSARSEAFPDFIAQWVGFRCLARKLPL